MAKRPVNSSMPAPFVHPNVEFLGKVPTFASNQRSQELSNIVLRPDRSNVSFTGMTGLWSNDRPVVMNG